MLINRSVCERTPNNRGRKFVGGVILLSVSTLVCKLIGLFFKIPIINIVGIEGMAFFSAAYNVYMLLNSIAAAGLPVALSIIVSRNLADGRLFNIKKVFKVALLLFVSIGFAGTVLLFQSAELYSSVVGLDGAVLSVRTIAPTILLITISGGLRGYFQGHEIMAPTAISQMIESLGKLVFGISLAYLAVESGRSLAQVAASAISGISIGALLSVLYLLIFSLIFRRKQKARQEEFGIQDVDCTRHIIAELFWIALPITLSSCLTSITSLADTALITNGLIASGFAENTAVALYSSYTNLAIPLFNLIPALVTPLAVSLIPTITAAITRKDSREANSLFSSSVRLCLGFSIPSAAGMAVFSKQILDLIYPNEAEACSFAAPLLSLLSLAIIFSCLTTVLNAVLQSYMKTTLPIISMGAGAVVKIVLEYILIRTNVGIFGAPISTVVGCFVILLTNVIFVTVFTPHRLSSAPFFKALAATAVCIAMAIASYCFIIRLNVPFMYALIVAVLIAVMVYSVVALKFGVVGSFELGHLPFGERLITIFKKLKLIK